jgi:NAD(P)-dependent dehydrogenase (short-subunit alcohol dehydrogenase family)
MNRFDGRHVLITGGASGIGLASAIRFAVEGAEVSIIDKNDLAFDKLKTELKEYCDQFHFFPADVTNASKLNFVINEVIQSVGEINILFANAGIGSGGLVQDLPEETWFNVIQTNLNGVFLTCKYAIPSLIKTPGNSIVTMASSMAGWDTGVGGAAYMASKEGVTGLTKSLALQLGRYGVRVNAICPGIIETPLSGGTQEEREVRYERFRQRIPLRRVGLPEDVAAAVAFLASDDARHITGSMLLIDGGQTLQSWSNAPDSDSFPLDYDPESLGLNF